MYCNNIARKNKYCNSIAKKKIRNTIIDILQYIGNIFINFKTQVLHIFLTKIQKRNLRCSTKTGFFHPFLYTYRFIWLVIEFFFEEFKKKSSLFKMRTRSWNNPVNYKLISIAELYCLLNRNIVNILEIFISQ